jgi:ribokinase
VISVLGSLNVDFVADVREFPRPGETIPSIRFRQECGGKGANQAAAVARMGQSVAMLGCVGDDALGNWMIEHVRQFGVDTTRVQRRAGHATGNALILVNQHSQNQIVVSAGANASLSPADIDRHAPTLIASQALLAQLECPLETVAHAFQLARNAGILTVLNPAPACKLGPGLLSHCDWLIPNEHEASILSGIPVHDPASAAHAATQLRQESPKTQIIITLGESGAWIDSDEGSGHHPGFPVTAVDTVGAGDTFVGAFLAERLRKVGVWDSVRFATAAAALSVMSPGAMNSIPSEQAVRTFIHSVQPCGEGLRRNPF